MGRSHSHADDADLVFDLTHHDAEFAGVGRHPVQDSGRGAHRIGAVELDTGTGRRHGEGLIARPHGERRTWLWRLLRCRLEVGRRVFVRRLCHAHVLRHQFLALGRELEVEYVLKG